MSIWMRYTPMEIVTAQSEGGYLPLLSKNLATTFFHFEENIFDTFPILRENMWHVTRHTCSAFLKEIYSSCSLTYRKIKFFSIYRENIFQTFSSDATEQRGVRGTCTSPNSWISEQIFPETSLHMGEHRSEILPNSGEYMCRTNHRKSSVLQV